MDPEPDPSPSAGVPSPEATPPSRGLGTKLAWGALVALPLHVLLLWASRSAPETVEAVYGKGLFPVISAIDARLDRLLSPLSPALVYLALLLGGVAWSVRRHAQPKRRFAWRLLIAAVVVAHFFPLCWGWCYWRPPVLERKGISSAPPLRAELEATGTLLGAAINRARVEWPDDPDWEDLDRRVDAAVLAFLRAEGLDEAARSRQIRFLPSGVMYVGGWTGITIPWTTEGWVDPALDPRILPVSIAHEKAHQAGFARESDANLIAFLALLRSPDPDLRYAALFDLAPLFGAQVPVVLAPAVVQDLVQAAAREEEVEVKVVRAATEVVYDSYLKANAVEPGIDDYDIVARRVQAWLKARPDDWARLEAIAAGR